MPGKGDGAAIREVGAEGYLAKPAMADRAAQGLAVQVFKVGQARTLANSAANAASVTTRPATNKR